MYMQEKPVLEVAAKEFAAEIQKLAESGCIESLSITICAYNSDKLFNLAKRTGIKELSVTAQFGA